MRKPFLPLILLAVFAAAPWAVGQTDPNPPKPIREIYIPFQDLDAILEKQPQRMLLKREEFLSLSAKAKKAAETHAPINTAVVSADYTATVALQRAIVSATLAIDCLEKGVQAVPLDLQGLSITRATLDDKDAAIGWADPAGNGPLTLFLEGVGRHELKLQMVAPVETTASQQTLRLRLPKAPAARLRLTAPGDVEIKGGAEVMRREVDAAEKLTRFEILPHDGDTAIAMTLNSHLQRQERAVIANTVALSEITQAYEKLHATVSLQILYKALDRFRFAVPKGFEILEVATPLLARWEVVEEDGVKILVVQLREQTTDPVAMNISAIKAPAVLDKWTAPQLKPLDVAGHVSVLGLLVEDRLRAESIEARDLISIDVAVLRSAMPESVLKAAPGAPALRPVAAWYAPDGGCALSANFTKPSAGLAVTASMVLKLTEQGQEVDGALAVLPEVEKRFALGFSVPAGWHVDRVTAPNGQNLAFEHYGDAGKPGRVEVRLPAGIPADQEYQLRFHAAHTPAGWLRRWDKFAVPFPVFAIPGATRDEGALAVVAGEDMDVRPEKIEQLTPLDEAKKSAYGLAGTAADLAWHYEQPGYQAGLMVTRGEPRVTARTVAFFQVKSEVLGAHYELAYQVDEARTRELTFVLPTDTPKAITIRALDDVKLKDPKSEDDGDLRRWTVQLEAPRRGKIRLAIDFDQSAAEASGKPVALPMITAEEVAYQSGLAAVEGSAELNVQVETDARGVDVGELVEADYQPGRRLLGAYGFVGEPPALKVIVDRTPAYALYPALVERAVLDTYLAAEGVSQTEANFTLKTKALLLELTLPAEAELWAATLDGQPIKPQCDGNRLLLSFPAANVPVARQLQFVYAAPVQSVTFAGKVEVPAPKLLLRAKAGATGELVPLGDLVWRLHLPTGYKLTRSLGNLSTTQLDRPMPAAVGVAGMLYELAGGVHPFYGATNKATELASMTSEATYGRGGRYAPKADGQSLPSPYYLSDDVQYAPPGKDAGDHYKGAATDMETPSPELAQRFDSLQANGKAREIESQLGVADEVPPGAKADGEKKLDFSGSVTSETDRGGGDFVDGTSVQPPAPAAEPAMTPPSAADPFSSSTTPPPARTGIPSQPRDLPLQVTVSETSTNKALLGMRSLRINLTHTPSQQTIVLRSLGEEPRLVVCLARSAHIQALGAGLAMLVLLCGFALTRSPARRKVRFVLAVLLFATLIPFLWLSTEVADVANMVFYAASALVPYYLLAALVRRCAGALAGWFAAPAAATTAMLMAAAITLLAADTSFAAEPPKPGADKYVVQVIEPSQPIQVPEDAIVIPFDPAAEEGVPKADRLLVPYAKYVELWNLAYPDRKIDDKPAPAPYALSGAAYQATLAGEEFLLVTGTLQFDVFSDNFVQVPLRLAGGVLARAELDGKPARLQTLEAQPPAQQPAQQSAQQSAQQVVVPPGAAPLAILHLSGKGRHKLELAVRMKIARRGGWRSIDGVLPNAPATAIELGVPDAQTEVRLGQVADRRSYDTEKPAEAIHTILGPQGQLSIQWRPKVAEGQVDQTLTAQSSAVLNVEEDGLRLFWRLALDFRRTQRERFTVLAPKDCLIERVEGPNVRGWTLKDTPQGQSIEVELLKAAKDREEFTVSVWRAGKVGAGELAEFNIPVIEVTDAALSSGEVTVCRSPLLDLRIVDAKGASRVDLGADAVRMATEAAALRPLGVKPFQAYRFATMPFTLRMAAQAKTLDLSATVQSIVNIADIRNTLSARIQIDPKGRPVHEVRILLPAELSLESVAVPEEFHWAVTRDGQRPLLTVYLAQGRQSSQDSAAITLRGRLAKGAAAGEAPLPQIEVLGAARQEGTLAIQVDPAYELDAVDLQKCQRVLLSRLFGWLQESQRGATRLAIEYREPGYSGTLKLSPRKAEVSCDTITNVRFTPTTVKETILLDYQILNAGVRGVSFTLPASAAGARISAPMLRQKTPQTQADGSVRWTIEFQDEVMGELRVLVQNDRALVRDALCPVPLAVVANARTNRRYIALESAGRDEVESIGPPEGIEPLGRRTKEWQALEAKLGGGSITQAWLVRQSNAETLSFRTRKREAVKTANAKILLAQAEIVVDSAGAYRALQTYKINNATEQYLEVRLPQDAELWTARVASEPVKPKQVPGDARSVRIPLVKTAEGELDYEVALRYGGKMPDLRAIEQVNFPLMRTVKIQPESSLLNLYLPKGYQWLRFNGTMHEVIDEAELDNERIAYQNKQLSGVLEASRQGDINSQIRAANSLKNIQFNNGAANYNSAGNGAVLQSNLKTNAALMQQAEVEVRKVEQSLQQVAEADNRDRLNDLFEGQKLSRARNVVQDLGDNWAMADQQAQPKAAAKSGEVQFNEGWLAKNGFAQVAAPAVNQPPADGKKSQQAKGQQVQQGQQGNVYWEGKAPSSGKPKAPQIAQQPAAQADVSKLSSSSRRNTQEDEGRQQSKKYYDRVQRQQAEQNFQQQALSANNSALQDANGYANDGGFQYDTLNMPNPPAGPGAAPQTRAPAAPNAPMGATAANGSPNTTYTVVKPAHEPQTKPTDATVGMSAPGVYSADLDVPFNGQAGGQGGGMGGMGGGMGGGQTATMPATGWYANWSSARAAQNPAAGLASLDIELPVRDETYEVHRFTTPRGEVELQAIAASRDWVKSVMSICAVLAVVLAGWGIVRLTSRGAAWITGPYGSTVLLVLGMASIVTGVLPVAGLAAAVIGTVIKVRRLLTPKVILAEAVIK